MSEKIITLLVHFVTYVIGLGGYSGVAALMGIESACIPLPSEIIMPFAGFLVSSGRFSLFWVATAGALGCNLGSVVAYWIGAKGGRPLVERYGRWVLMSHHDLDRMTEFFNRYGSITVLSPGFCPWCAPSSPFPRESPRCRSFAFTFTHSSVPGPGVMRWPTRAWCCATGGTPTPASTPPSTAFISWSNWRW